MFNRLFILFLLIAATVSVSSPAHASSLSVFLSCEQTSGGQSFGTFFCYATASGTPSYTFHWYEYEPITGYFLVQQGSDNVYSSWCQTNVTTRVRVVVTDSFGYQGEAIRSFKCGNPY